MPTKSVSDAVTEYKGLNFQSMLHECFLCGVLTIDSTGRISSISPEVERVLDLPASTRKARTIDILPKPLRSMIHDVQDSGNPVTDMTIGKSAGPGKDATFVTILPITEGKGKRGAVVLLKHASAVSKIEHSIRRLDRLASIGLLSASMAHEIKNALVAVRTFVDLLLEKQPEAELGGIVRSEMSRVDSIISHLLRFGAPGQPVFTAVPVHDVLDHAARLVQHHFSGRTITLTREFDAPTDGTRGDRHQLEQAFMNLLLNAYEALESSGALTIRTRLLNGAATHRNRDTKFISITISDNGPGIPAENLARLFQPFFTTKRHGTGLGLAITRGIIEEHGGNIRVESTPGKGTTFTVELPAHIP